MKNSYKYAALLILIITAVSCSSGKNKIGCPSFTQVEIDDQKETDFVKAKHYVVHRSESVFTSN